MTYSIVAHDPHTNQHGVAVQTCNLAVGVWVPWAEGGVGAVATQAKANRSYGLLGLDLMRGGLAAPQALAALLAADEERAFRQVAMIDAHGRIAQHMGLRCLPQAGMTCGEGFAVQANMMARDTVWGAMAEAFEHARKAGQGNLAHWMLAALDAAEAEGGDMRGRQAAALLVVGPVDDRLGRSDTARPAGTAAGPVDERLDRSDTARPAGTGAGPVDERPECGGRIPLVDLRVDHHPQPLQELRRLLRLHRAYDAEYKIGDLAGAGQREQAYALVQKILAWAPGEEYLRYLCAVHLAGALQRQDEALDLLRPLAARRPMWLDYLRRDMETGVFGVPGASAALYEALQEETD